MNPNWIDRVLMTGIIVGYAYLTYFNIIEPLQEGQRYFRAYQSILTRFADTNHDGHISAYEETDLLEKLFPDLRVDRLGKIPHFPDGTEVPLDALERRVSDYEKKH